MTVHAKVVRSGESRTLTIPKQLLDKLGDPEVVACSATGDGIVVRADRHPRAGWEEAFAAAGPDPEMHLGHFANRFDDEE